jgi:two-component system, NtrC family, sensor histidine kinase HydH
MIRPPSHFRYLLPIVLSGLVSFALCAAVAVFLFQEQSSSAEALGENIASHQAASALEESLAALITVLQTRPEGVPALNDRAAEHIAGARAFADHADEQAMVDRLEDGFARYQAIWSQVAANTSDRSGRDRAESVLRSDVFKVCQELREYNARRIVDSELEHRSTLRKLAWGLAAIGGSAGLAGLFLGFGVARGLSRSIQRIQVRVQGAAGMLGQDLPAVELVGGGTLSELDQQVQALVGRVEGVVATLQQREREVRRAEQLVAVGQLAAGMAHEIRNPMTSIKMLVQTGREGGETGLGPEDLAVMEREVRRVERSLQTFLDYARPPKPAKSPTGLIAVARECIDLTRGRAARQQVAVRLFEPADLVKVDADPDQLRQVLVNLALNALDAMPSGGELTIEVDADGPEAVIRVMDTGVGIAPAIRERLFEPFASTKDTGLGLGLVICQRIVEDHGGSIRAESPACGGARFIVRLPRILSNVNSSSAN